MNLQCSLCKAPSETPFCCSGCEMVFNLLQEKGVTELDTPIPESRPEEVLRLRFEIEDLFCIYCKEVIEWVLKRKEGIIQIVVDYATDLCLVDYDPRKILPEEIFATIRSLRYTPKQFDEKQKNRPLTLRLGISAFFALNTMMFSYSAFVGSYFFAALSFLTSLPIMFYTALPIFKRGILSALRGFFGMETLVTIGVFSSFLLSTYNLWQGFSEVYYDTLSVIVTFVLFGKVLEQKAKFSAKDQMRLLFKSLPKRARVGDTFILIKDLKEGDQITSLLGEKIVVDGEVVEGEGLVDVSLLTGESQPLYVTIGSQVKSGSILIDGHLKYIRTEAKSELESIVELVEQGLLNKQTTKTLLDYLLPFFVPLVVVLALFSPEPLAVLLISCPCAIGIAIPLAESKMLEKLLSIGVVVRNRRALSLLGNETAYVFDKTGTLTTKEFKVTSDLGGYAPIIKSLALHSTHPVARALAKIEGPTVPLTGVREVMGKGIVAEGYFLGSSPLVFMETGKPPVRIDLEDVIRPEVPALLSALQGIDLYLYSGDHPRSVEAVAHTLGITHFAAHLTPQQKKERIESMQGTVAFVGDGLNDAAAISAASLSFVPLNGADLTSQAADFLLTKEDLTLIAETRRIAKRGQRVIRYNLFFAFFYNLVGIPLAFMGLLNPILASVIMVASSLTVVLHSRLNFRDSKY